MSKVTVALNAYNGMPYLPAAVESIQNQTLEDIQIIIVNDGSEDGSREYLDSLQDSRVRIIHQENQGCSVASNVAIRECKTPYLARMDADDIALPRRLECQLAFLESHPEVGMVGTQTACLGTHSVGGSIMLPTTHEAIWNSLLDGRHAMAHPTVMMRTERIRSVGGYWNHRLSDDDTDMMLRMGEVARLSNLADVQYHYRIHQGSLSATNVRGMRFSYEYAIELAMRRHNNLPPITPDEFAGLKENQPWYRRWAESLDIHARCQYRHAMEELYGNHPLRGRLRLMWAALCSPRLTTQRIGRMFGHSRSERRIAAKVTTT